MTRAIPFKYGEPVEGPHSSRPPNPTCPGGGTHPPGEATRSLIRAVGLGVPAIDAYPVGPADATNAVHPLGSRYLNGIGPQEGPIEIQVQAEQAPHEVLISIRDWGMGIPTGQQAQIFARFLRADNAREAGIGGTGLGLYLCRELVELHGGRIWFASTEGAGSTFFITLPQASDATTNEQ